MSCDNPDLGKLLIECPQIVIDSLNISSEFITVVNTVKYLTFYVLHEEYTRIEEGEKSTYQDTFSSSYYFPNVIRVGFTAKLTYDEAFLKYALQYISKISGSSGYYQHIPVTVIDYIHPEFEDVVASRDYTVRKGLLSVDPGSGITKGYLADGINISFKEVNKRLGI